MHSFKRDTQSENAKFGLKITLLRMRVWMPMLTSKLS